MIRGNKRQATGSPSPPSPHYEELHSTIQNIIRLEFSEIQAQLNSTITSTIQKELIPVRDEMKEIIQSMQFMNAKFEEIERMQKSSTELIKRLETENSELKSSIENLSIRINNIEQQSRSNNLEIQCLPENKNENLINTINQLGQIINCPIQEKDIFHCSRVAKINTSSTRPRSVVVQLASTRLRDQILAAVIKFNQNNPQEKLNSAHLGYSAKKSPVYVVEHLSPANKVLHAATRIKAKEIGYKFVWIRNGKIFVRKSEGTEYVVIKNKNSLSKLK
ncbi:uncharacterized protein LOC123701071 [Colias croceus]|uniref:uncharacterized protein LOC123701071 n=1 Tax=Colias crocea TaxID=72248 RepID=UPI001E2811D3|nr:uncharacterized protein LOC123701071 [Colias croceus]